MKNILILGDSFCHHRTDKKLHWPAILAEKLTVNLYGEGFHGKSWWPSKKFLNAVIDSPAFEPTEYIVLCHTQVDRIITHTEFYDPMSYNPNHPSHKDFKFWVKNFYVPEFQVWCYENWFRELNRLLKGKKVIHVGCFETYSESLDILDGIVIQESLIEFTPWLSKYAAFLTYSNHLSKRRNQWLANKLAEIFLNYDEYLKTCKEKNSRFSLLHTK